MKIPIDKNSAIDEKLVVDAATKSKSMIGVGKDHRPF